MGDVKCYLRKMDFPSVVPEALRHIQKLWLPDCSSQQIGLMKELCEEFVFFEIDKWGNNRNQKLPPIKELQIVERIAWYFRQHENDQKMATFHFLFPFGSKILDNRLPVLGKLLSLAIATENGNVLTYLGTWMQLCSTVSEYSVFIAKSVINEHIKALVPSERMKSLPYLSPIFCASLVTAITNMYITSCPPPHLIGIILDWINSVPSLCFAPFKLTIPKSFNFPGPQTPIAGLMCWCILSPLYKEHSKESEKCGVSDATFSSLLLSILQCMMKFNSRDATRCDAVPVPSIFAIIDTLKEMHKTEFVSKELHYKAMDRFAMCLEVALSKGCVSANSQILGQLLTYSIELPFNRSFKLVVEKWASVLKDFNKS